MYNINFLNGRMIEGLIRIHKHLDITISGIDKNIEKQQISWKWLEMKRDVFVSNISFKHSKTRECQLK